MADRRQKQTSAGSDKNPSDSKPRTYQRAPPPKRESAINLDHLVGKKIRVKFMHGREVEGTLKGNDGLVNIVLDDAVEYLRDPETGIVGNKTRSLGLTVCRGTSVVAVYPVDGTEQIDNPFVVTD